MSLLTVQLGAILLFLWLPQSTRQLSPEIMAKPAELFPVAAATAGAGPAIIEYWLDGRAHRVTMSIRSASGTPATELRPRIKRGVSRVTWNLQIVPPGIDAREVRRDVAKKLALPLALPGAYTVRMTVDGTVHEQKLQVNEDPRLKMTAAERRVWTETQVRLWQMAAGAERLKGTVSALGEQGRRQPGTRSTATVAALKKLEKPLDEIAERSEELLRKIIPMTRSIGAGDLAKVDEYAAALEKHWTEVRALQAGMRGAPAR